MPRDGWWASLWPDPGAVVAAVGVHSGMRVVDLCAGDGWFTVPIAGIASETIAIDIDPQMTATLRQRLSGVSTARVLTGDAYEVAELIGPPADFILLANAFHGVPDRPRLVAAVARALRPGGLLAVINWHRLPRDKTRIEGVPRGPASEQRLGPEQATAAIVGGSFSLERTLELPPYHYALMLRRRSP